MKGVKFDGARTLDREGVKFDGESDTVAFRRVAPALVWLPKAAREHLTPMALWSALGVLTVAIGYVLNAQNDLHRHQESIADLQRSHTTDQALLQRIDTQLAVMGNKLDDIGDEVDRQRAWRDKIEGIAESTPTRRLRVRRK